MHSILFFLSNTLSVLQLIMLTLIMLQFLVGTQELHTCQGKCKLQLIKNHGAHNDVTDVPQKYYPKLLHQCVTSKIDFTIDINTSASKRQFTY